MGVRLVRNPDFGPLLLLARGAAVESEAELGFDEKAFRETFNRCLSGELTGWVCMDEDEIVGFLLASINGFYFTGGLSTKAEIVYVTPAKRGTRAPALLLDEFFRWSRNVGARRKYLGIDNSLHPERTARFFERYGARRVGVFMAAD